jgi:hypothetical protein
MFRLIVCVTEQLLTNTLIVYHCLLLFHTDILLRLPTSFTPRSIWT